MRGGWKKCGGHILRNSHLPNGDMMECVGRLSTELDPEIGFRECIALFKPFLILWGISRRIRSSFFAHGHFVIGKERDRERENEGEM